VIIEYDFMLKVLGRKAALTAVYAERYVLSPVYLYFAWIEFHALWLESASTKDDAFVVVARHVILLLLNFFVGILLLLGRRADVPPQKLKDILVPLITSFFNLTYNAIPWFPTSVQKSLCPPGLQTPLTVTGLVLSVIGPAVAIWGIIYLGRSFGVFVVVRKVILGGPYQWVRHPMYLGYICMLAGLILANFSAAYFVLVPIHITLLLYRAWLEEVRLSEYSVEYREYRKRAGFIFPRLRRPAPGSPEAA
jgi:protein-S-isoprenylcysteine O-methyltransferase Ste14